MLTKWDERMVFSGAARVAVEFIGAVVFVFVTKLDFATGTVTLRGAYPWNYLYLTICTGLFGAWVFLGAVQAIGAGKALRSFWEARLKAGQDIHDFRNRMTESLARIENLEEQTGIVNPYATGGQQDGTQAPRTG